MATRMATRMAIPQRPRRRPPERSPRRRPPRRRPSIRRSRPSSAGLPPRRRLRIAGRPSAAGLQRCSRRPSESTGTSVAAGGRPSTRPPRSTARRRPSAPRASRPSPWRAPKRGDAQRAAAHTWPDHGRTGRRPRHSLLPGPARRAARPERATPRGGSRSTAASLEKKKCAVGGQIRPDAMRSGAGASSPGVLPDPRGRGGKASGIAKRGDRGVRAERLCRRARVRCELETAGSPADRRSPAPIPRRGPGGSERAGLGRSRVGRAREEASARGSARARRPSAPAASAAEAASASASRRPVCRVVACTLAVASRRLQCCGRRARPPCGASGARAPRARRPPCALGLCAARPAASRRCARRAPRGGFSRVGSDLSRRGVGGACGGTSARAGACGGEGGKSEGGRRRGREEGRPRPRRPEGRGGSGEGQGARGVRAIVATVEWRWRGARRRLRSAFRHPCARAPLCPRLDPSFLPRTRPSCSFFELGLSCACLPFARRHHRPSRAACRLPPRPPRAVAA